MKKIARFSSSLLASLPARLIFNSVALVVLTAAAVGLPATWLILRQLDRQAWALVSQGEDTARALFADAQMDLGELAILTAQRPTLLQMIDQGEASAFQAYLNDLQRGADLDLIVVCGPDRRPIARAGQDLPGETCLNASENDLYVEADGSRSRGWLLAWQPLPAPAGNLSVVVGQALDAAFAVELRQKTGLEHSLLFAGHLLATSFPVVAGLQQAVASSFPAEESPAGGELHQAEFPIAGAPYYSASSTLEENGLQSVVSLPVADIHATQRNLMWAMIGGMFAIAVLGSILGVLTSGQISRPLARLKDAAVALSKGNLATRIDTRTNLPEVALVTYALEDARVALQGTLTELHQEKDWVDHLLGSIVEGIITLDWQGRVTFFSHGAERITGWPQDRVIGRPVDNFLQPVEGEKRFSQQIPASGQKQKIIIASQSGRPVTLAVTSASLLPPGAGRGGTALVLRDVSDEEALRRLLGDFLANIAHEFRTPLSAVAVSTGLLLDQLPDLTLEEQRELINSIHLGVTGLRTLIDNLLQGASIETGRFRVYPKPVFLDEILKEALVTIQPLLDKYGQRLELALPAGLPAVSADALRSAQVLVNLLSNAIKWSPEGAQIDLAVEARDDCVKVSVADQGPGIPKEQQPNLFRRFVHVDSGSGRAEYGAGLGLSVVKAIVEAQGGQVGVLDRPGGGVIFWFTVPYAAEREAAASLAS